jgi:hypothetical protein
MVKLRSKEEIEKIAAAGIGGRWSCSVCPAGYDPGFNAKAEEFI